MARLAWRLAENVPGPFFVDRTCIDCDTCRQLAPSVFAQSSGEQSFVARQPQTPAEEERSLAALVACPTASIGVLGRREETRAAAARFPEPIEDEVEYCGYTSASSFGASSYLIRRRRGNVLVDSPRAAGPLLRRLDESGGVRLLFLTHRDDVADHRAFRGRYGCERVLHAADVGDDTRDVERRLDGTEPVVLDEDLLAIPVPGHTKGSVALLYRETFLFTGDHLWWSEPRRRLHASRGVCWYSWPEQRRSLERLLDFRFRWVLPGHGRRHLAPTAEAMRDDLRRAIDALS